MEEKELNEQESISLISEMIQKAKSSFHESGTSAILWGSVVAFCGLVSFMQAQFGFSIGFDTGYYFLWRIYPDSQESQYYWL